MRAMPDHRARATYFGHGRHPAQATAPQGAALHTAAHPDALVAQLLRHREDHRHLRHVLDEVLELLSIPFTEADLRERNPKLCVFECTMKPGLQFIRDRERANARNEVLERLAA